MTRASGSGEEPGRAGERRGDAVRRAELVGRAERQHLPPRLARRGEPVDEPVRLAVEPAPTAARSDGAGCRRRERGPRFDPSSSVRLRTCPSRRRRPHGSRSRTSTPQVDCGRYPVKRTRRRARSTVTARIFRDGHETLGAAVRYRRPGSTRWPEAPLEPHGNDLWTGSFAVDAAGPLGASASRHGSTASRRWQDELRRKVAAGQADLAGELSEGAVLLGREVLTVDECARRTGRRPLRARRGRRRYDVDVDRELARFGSWYELFPRSWGGFAGRRAAAAAPRRARLRRRLPAPDPPDRRTRTARAATTPSARSRATSAARGRSAAEEGGHDAIDPDLGTRRRLRATRRRRDGARDRDRARLRDPVLARPPVARRAPGVVPAAAPTGRSSTPRTRPSATRTSTTSTSTATTGRRSGRRCSTSSSTGSARRHASSASTTRTRSRCRSGSG